MNTSALALEKYILTKAADIFDVVNAGGGNAKRLEPAKNIFGRYKGYHHIPKPGGRWGIPLALGAALPLTLGAGYAASQGLEKKTIADRLKEEGQRTLQSYKTPDWLNNADSWVSDRVPAGLGQAGEWFKNLSPEWKAVLGIGAPLLLGGGARMLFGGNKSASIEKMAQGVRRPTSHQRIKSLMREDAELMKQELSQNSRGARGRLTDGQQNRRAEIIQRYADQETAFRAAGGYRPKPTSPAVTASPVEPTTAVAETPPTPRVSGPSQNAWAVGPKVTGFTPTPIVTPKPTQTVAAPSTSTVAAPSTSTVAAPSTTPSLGTATSPAPYGAAVPSVKPIGGFNPNIKTRRADNRLGTGRGPRGLPGRFRS